MSDEIWKITTGEGPLVVAAIHDGHAIRSELQPHLAIKEDGRRREEDPYTGAWTEVAEVRLVGLRSRFEVDLNRQREKAIYLKPEDAWGLQVWKGELPEEQVRRSLDEYDHFYQAARKLFDGLVQRHGHFVVYDLHTYNHRRDGAEAAIADPVANPEVNIGTGTMDRAFWAPVIDSFMDDLSSYDFMGRSLDVRENVRFQGGGFGRWIHETYPKTGCAISIEFKKFFMDEWSGELFPEQHAAIKDALTSTIPGVLQQMEKVPQV